MKYLLLLTLFASPVFADDAASAFATGFANALNVQMGGRPYYAPQQVQVQEVYQAPAPVVRDPHVDAVTSDNRKGGYYFFNTSECLRFLHRSGFAAGYTSCTDVY